MNDFEKYVVEWISIPLLVPHPKVQRGFDQTRAEIIADTFDPDLFRELYVVKVGRVYQVFDGQTRLWAATKALGKDQKLPCRVWDSIPLERQAQLFLGINNAKALKAIDRWIQRLLANEEVPTAITGLLRKHNLRVSKTRGDGAVQAVMALETIWRREGGAANLHRVLSILGSAWGRAPEAYDAMILRGVAGVVHHFGNDGLDEKELASKLARKGTPDGMVGKVRDQARVMSKGTTKTMFDLIVNIYNERRRTNRLKVSSS